MQVSRISIRYWMCKYRKPHNDNTPLSFTHSRSQLLTSNKLQELVLDQYSVSATITCTGSGCVVHMTCHVKYRYKPILTPSSNTSSSDTSNENIDILASVSPNTNSHKISHKGNNNQLVQFWLDSMFALLKPDVTGR